MPKNGVPEQPVTLSHYSENDKPRKLQFFKTIDKDASAIPLPVNLVRKMNQDMLHAHNVLTTYFGHEDVFQQESVSLQNAVLSERQRIIEMLLTPLPVFGRPHLVKQIFQQKVKALFSLRSENRWKSALGAKNLEIVLETIRKVESTRPGARAFMLPLSATPYPVNIVYFSSARIVQLLSSPHPTIAVTGCIVEEYSHHLLALVHRELHQERGLSLFAEMLQAVDRMRCFYARVDQMRDEESYSLDWNVYQEAVPKHLDALRWNIVTDDLELQNSTHSDQNVYVPSHVFAAYYMEFLNHFRQGDELASVSFEKRFYFASNKVKIQMLIDEIPSLISSMKLPVSWPVATQGNTLIWYMPVGTRFMSVIDQALIHAGMEPFHHATHIAVNQRPYRETLHLFQSVHNLPEGNFNHPYVT